MGLSVFTYSKLVELRIIVDSFKNNVNITSFAGIWPKLKSEAKSFTSPDVTFKNISKNVSGVGRPGILGKLIFITFSTSVCGLGNTVKFNISGSKGGTGRDFKNFCGLGKLRRFGNVGGGGKPGITGNSGNVT